MGFGLTPDFTAESLCSLGYLARSIGSIELPATSSTVTGDPLECGESSPRFLLISLYRLPLC